MKQLELIRHLDGAVGMSGHRASAETLLVFDTDIEFVFQDQTASDLRSQTLI